MVLSIIFLILASICNAIMDITTHHFYQSIFIKIKNQKWWNTSDSWKNKYVNGNPKFGRVKWFFGINKPVQLTDSWHFFKMLMIIFICVSIITFNFVYPLYLFPILLLVYGIIWNLTFSLFYNKILSIK